MNQTTRNVLVISAIILVISFLGNCLKASKRNRYTLMEGFNEPMKELIFFKASWCGHCKRFGPVWDEFKASAAKEFPHVKITELDVDLNEEHKQGFRFSKHKVQGFPTVLITDENDNTAVPFKGARTLEDLKKFLAENA